MDLNAKQLDRAVGALVGAAAGDALGVPYEFGSRPLPGAGEPAEMLGGGLGGYEPGQWSDDTEMACVIAQVAATGADLRDESALDEIAAGFLDWHSEAADVGIQTRRVLSGLVGSPRKGLAERMRTRAAELCRPPPGPGPVRRHLPGADEPSRAEGCPSWRGAGSRHRVHSGRR